jgi:hypothetical protein
MLPAGQQAAGMPADPEDLSFDVLEQVIGQHDLVAADGGTLEEVHRCLPAGAEHLGPEADHLAAEDASLTGQALDLGEDRGELVRTIPGDLQHHLGV